MIRLTVQVPGLPERALETEERRISIGRGHTNLLVLDNPHVSTHHARVEITDRGAMLLDLGSTNGSMLQRGSRKIPVAAGGAGVVLEPGDVAVLGDSAAPVTLVVLELDLGSDAESLADPPSTTISAAPVDPSTGGMVRARRPSSSFGTLPSGIRARPRATQAIYDLASVVGGAQLTPLVDAAAAAIFTLCPALSHVFVEIRDFPEDGDERSFYRVRGGGEAGQSWRPNRVLVARTGIAHEAWLVVHTCLEPARRGIKPPPQVPAAICVPLLGPDQPQGVLHVDNRATNEGVDDDDLAIVAAVGHLLSLALEHCRRARQAPAPDREQAQE